MYLLRSLGRSLLDTSLGQLAALVLQLGSQAIDAWVEQASAFRLVKDAITCITSLLASAMNSQCLALFQLAEEACYMALRLRTLKTEATDQLLPELLAACMRVQIVVMNE